MIQEVKNLPINPQEREFRLPDVRFGIKTSLPFDDWLHHEKARRVSGIGNQAGERLDIWEVQGELLVIRSKEENGTAKRSIIVGSQMEQRLRSDYILPRK